MTDWRVREVQLALELGNALRITNAVLHGATAKRTIARASVAGRRINLLGGLQRRDHRGRLATQRVVKRIVSIRGSSPVTFELAWIGEVERR